MEHTLALILFVWGIVTLFFCVILLAILYDDK